MPSYYKTNLGMGREKIHTYYSCHIPGHKSINADRRSMELSYNLERMLCPKALYKVLKILKFNLDADTFVSNINYRFRTYFSYKADPKAKAVDSFIVTWHSLKFYAFLPFSVISRTMKKIKAEKDEGILVVLYCTLPSLVSSVI